MSSKITILKDDWRVKRCFVPTVRNYARFKHYRLIYAFMQLPLNNAWTCYAFWMLGGCFWEVRGTCLEVFQTDLRTFSDLVLRLSWDVFGQFGGALLR